MSPSVSSAGCSKVMVVDDDALSLTLASLLLKSGGYQTVEANGGTAAIDLLTNLQPDDRPSVVLADLRMPGLSGQSLAAALRQVAPDTRLVAMSATPSPAEGYDAFVSKPLDLETLRAALDGRDRPGSAVSATSAQLPVLDEGVLERMNGMMPRSAVREVYEACLNDVRERIPEMRTAAAAGNLSSVRRTAHTFKGSAGMIGAKRLAASAAELELGEYQQDDVSRLIDNLLSCCDELHRILKSKL